MKSLQLESPHAIIVIGIRGSGKTFFARKFAETFKAPFLEQEKFYLCARDTHFGDDLFASVSNEIAKTNRSLVIELISATRTERTELAKRLRSHGYVPMFVWVQVDEETANYRARKKAKLFDGNQLPEYGNFSIPHVSEKALVISGKHTFATQAKAVLRKLTGPRPQQGSHPTPQPPRPSQPSRGQIIIR